jgi:hypothetical protein
MAATTDINHENQSARWPLDLKIFALLAALWAAGLTARIVMRDLTYYSPTPIEAILLGMKFDGYPASLVMAAQVMAAFTVAIGLAAERKWGLLLGLICMLEVVVSNLIFMTTYMDDLAEARNVRLAGLVGIGSVLILLYLWIRARDLLFE